MHTIYYAASARQSLRAAFVTLASAVIFLAGCSHTAQYNKGYVPTEQAAFSKRLDGKLLIYTLQTDDDYKFKGNPASFTGNATTLELPLGVMTREIAGIVFGALFTGGAEKSNALTNLDQYSLVLTPKTSNFEYAYNQAKNLGFAITPQAQLKLNVKLIDAEKNTFYENNYESGITSGGSYLISGSPAEKINQIVHRVLYEQMQRAAKDVYREQRLHTLNQLKAKNLVTEDEFQARKKSILEAQ